MAVIWKLPRNPEDINKIKDNELIREDGRIERLCKHGVGHPIGHVSKWLEWMGVHGCDGCCYKAEFYLNKED